ncbi:MAG: helix-turn-helix domain-containing protein [Synechococcus sp. H1_metabat_bins_2.tsv.006]|nr:helix-turn-helix domain-containing protein [Synechococcus sp. H1_metabat_bins_2.tsv.006]
MGDQNQPLNASARSNPGAVLLQARTALGLSREQLAEQLHMRPHQIEALECHQQERWPEAVFTIAQVRRLASALGLDAEPVVEAFRADLSQQTTEASPAAKAVFQLGRSEPTAQAKREEGQRDWLHESKKDSKAKASPVRFQRPSWLVPSIGVVALLAIGGVAISRNLPALQGQLAAIPKLWPKAPAKPSADAAVAATPKPQPTTLDLSLSEPVWMSVRQLVGQKQLFEGLMQPGPHSFPLGTGVQVLAGRPDLVMAHIGDQPAKALGSIETIQWVTFKPPVAAGSPTAPNAG